MTSTAIVVLNYRAADSTKRLLHSLGQQVGAEPFTVFVVDNASTDDSYEQLAKFAEDLNGQLPGPAKAQFKVLRAAQNLGYAGGMNFGLRAASASGADFFWILTQDLTVEADALARLQKLWQGLERPGLLGAVTDLNATDEIYFAGAQVDLKGRTSHPTEGMRLAQVPELLSAEYSQTDYVNGACVFTHRSVLEKIGFIAEVYFMYFEDVEWGLAARKAGFINYFSHRARIHHHRGNQDFNPVAEYYCRRNSFLFKRRNGFAGAMTKFIELNRQRKYLLKSTLKSWLNPSDSKAKQLRLILSDVVRDIKEEVVGKRPSTAPAP
jgi:GT2 family glycosyltransferase